MGKKTTSASSNDIANKIRRIICTSTFEAPATGHHGTDDRPEQQVSRAYLNATRAMNNKNHIGLNFLIGSVEEFVQSVWDQTEVVSRPMTGKAIEVIKTWSVFKKLCNDSGIGLFQINEPITKVSNLHGLSVHKVLCSDSDEGGLKQDMGQILYKEIGSRGGESGIDTTITVGSSVNSAEFKNVGVLIGKYCLYVHAQLDHTTMPYVSFILQSLFEQVSNNMYYNDINHNIISDKKIFQEIINNDVNKEGTVDSIMRENSNEIFKNAIKTIAANSSSMIAFNEINSTSNICVCPSPVTVLWIKTNHGITTSRVSSRSVVNVDSYLPGVLYNKETKKLNFLVWYSDADNTNGFMRHACVKEDDALSPRLTLHAKMLVYCEIMERQNRYYARLLNALNNQTTQKKENTKYDNGHQRMLTLQNTIFRLLTSNVPDNEKLSVIPLINEFYYFVIKSTQDLQSPGNNLIQNAFGKEKIIEGCLQVIFRK